MIIISLFVLDLAATNGDYIYGRSVGTAVTMSLACNRQTPYEAGTFITLVKDGKLSKN